MLEWIRVNKRWAQVILGLLILPFAFTGMQGYLERNARGSNPATVGDSEVTQAEFERAVASQLERLRSSMGAAFDSAALDSPEFRRSILDQMIDQKVVANGARKALVSTPDELLRRAIAGEPSLQENGRFSIERYRQLIAAQGMSERDFENRIRLGLATDQLASLPAVTANVPQLVAERFSSALAQKRTVQTAIISSDDEAHKVEPTAEQIESYYSANKQLFEIPETVSIEYLVLDASSVGSKLDVSEDDLRKFYEQNKQLYATAEQRDAAHILIAAGQGASAEEVKQAEAKANDLLAKLKASPSSFAQLARENSDDPGSKTAGGELGSFGRGMMVKPFEDAVFSLKPGQISEVVRTDFGFHIIRLNSVSGGAVKPFAEVRNQVEAEVRRQLGKRKFAEAAEQFGNLVYEQADSLKPAAERLGLVVQRADNLQRSGAGGVLSERRVLDAVFSDDAINGRHNTAAIDAGTDRLVSARVVEHSPVRTESLDVVRPKIVEAVKRQEGQAKASDKGQALLKALRAGESPELAFGAAQETDRLAPAKGLTPVAVAAIFAADDSKLPAYAGSPVSGGYAIYRITTVTAVSPESDRTRAIATQYEQMMSTAEAGAMIAGMRSREKISIHLDKSR